MTISSAYCALVDSVYINGVVTNNFQNATYVSIRDSFDQEYLFPKKILMKKTGRKIAGSTEREFKGSIFFLELSVTEYATLAKQCQVDIKPTKAKSSKKCPPNL